MTTEVQVTPIGVWFYGIGECDDCHIYHHLYVSSEVRGKALCPEHFMGTIHGILANRYEYTEVWNHYHAVEQLMYDYRTVVPEIQPEAHEYCGTCHRPFGKENVSRIAGQYHSGTPALFHRDCCVQNCSVCEIYVPRWSWSYPLGANNRTYYEYLRDISQSGAYVNPSILEGERYCESHLQDALMEIDYFECERCSEFFDSNRSTYFMWHSDFYCGECRDEMFSVCDYCDTWYDIDNGHDCGEDESGIIHAYSYKPFYTHFGTAPYHLGFELEVESHSNSYGLNDSAEQLLKILGDRTYFKYDGSVDNGFEIVTHPHSLHEFQEKFPWRFIDKAKSLSLRSWNADSSCGFHVHVGRVAFGPGKLPDEPDRHYLNRTIIVRQRHEIRFTKLFYENQRQVERLAGRSSEFARFNDKKNVYNKVKHGHSYDGRYSVVNTENRDTIEIRIFKGSLNQPRLLANIELVHCAVEYTRDLRVTGANKALSWLKFTGYVAENMEKYPHLFALMEKTFSNEPLYDNRTESNVFEGVE